VSRCFSSCRSSSGGNAERRTVYRDAPAQHRGPNTEAGTIAAHLRSRRSVSGTPGNLVNLGNPGNLFVSQPLPVAPQERLSAIRSLRRKTVRSLPPEKHQRPPQRLPGGRLHRLRVVADQPRLRKDIPDMFP